MVVLVNPLFVVRIRLELLLLDLFVVNLELYILLFHLLKSLLQVDDRHLEFNIEGLSSLL